MSASALRRGQARLGLRPSRHLRRGDANRSLLASRLDVGLLTSKTSYEQPIPEARPRIEGVASSRTPARARLPSQSRCRRNAVTVAPRVVEPPKPGIPSPSSPRPPGSEPLWRTCSNRSAAIANARTNDAWVELGANARDSHDPHQKNGQRRAATFGTDHRSRARRLLSTHHQATECRSYKLRKVMFVESTPS